MGSIRHQISRHIQQPKAIEEIRTLMANHAGGSRYALASAVCARFGFVDVCGRQQLESTVSGLKELDKKGLISLPPPRHNGTGGWKPRRVNAGVPAPQGVPDAVDAIENLRIERVIDSQQSAIWNELVIKEHPQGNRPLVGRQLRYLIVSEHGYLGALGFAAAALQLKARDQWIGWDMEGRREHLDRVICLSRFLIRSEVRCDNLATRVLAMVMQRLVDDFTRCYGFTPYWVETFIDNSVHIGTLFRAANWIAVGQSCGRGRQDRQRACAETIKDIYMYVLDPEFRKELGLPADAGKGPLQPAAGLDADHWAENEFGAAELGDQRLTNRLVKMADAQAKKPGTAFAEIFAGDPAAVTGAYRFIEHPDVDAITMATMLAPHQERTARRMAAQPLVLLVQDSCDLAFDLPQCTGLGFLGTNKASDPGESEQVDEDLVPSEESTGKEPKKGLRLHSTLAVTPTGLPLGITHTSCYARKLTPNRKGMDRRKVPIEEKETYRWLEHLDEGLKLKSTIPHTRVVMVADREADFFEMFDHQRQNSSVDLLIRATHDRRTDDADVKLFESVRQEPVATQIIIELTQRGAQPKSSGQNARKARKISSVVADIRYRNVLIYPPKQGLNCRKEPVAAALIHVYGESEQPDSEPIEWYLLTSLSVDTPEDALECIWYYRCRWRIEDYHKVLKSSCTCATDPQYRLASRLDRSIAINIVVAWRVFLMTLLGRETVELPAEILFSELELKVLNAYAKSRELPTPTTAQAAVRTVGIIGGHLARKHDPPVGAKVLYRGYVALQIMCIGFSIAETLSRPDMGCG